MQTEPPPPGFEPMPHRRGFVTTCATFFFDRARSVVGARITADHLNPLAIAHGGLLATLADTGFGMAIRAAAQAERPPATISLGIDYLNPAREGDWVETHVEV